MKINFMDLYDVTLLFNGAIKDKYSPAYTHMYIQQDTWDFQIYRIQKGDYEENQVVYTVENQKISKSDVLDKLKMNDPKIDVRSAFEYIYGYEVFMAILKLDADSGYENWEYETCETLEEAVSMVTEDHYTVHPVDYIDSPEYDEESLSPHYALQDAEILIGLLLKDERANTYTGVTINTYENCREQGYSLQFIKDGQPLAISFSRYRSSDSFIVYYGPRSEQTISEAAYEKMESFSYRDFANIRSYIFELLEQDAPKNDGSQPSITFHPNLQLIRNLWEELKSTPAYQATRGSVDCYQLGDRQGYTFVRYYANPYKIHFTTDDAKQILVTFEKQYGADSQTTYAPRTFSVDEKDQALNFILSTLEETNQEKLV